MSYPTPSKNEHRTVIIGEEGSGKSLLFDWMMKEVFGLDHSVAYDSVDRLVGRFNGLADGKIFAIINKVSNYGGCVKTNDKLKNIIVNPTLTMVRKFENSCQVDDYQNFIMMLTNKWPIRATRRSRRPFVLDSSDEYRGNEQYFSALARHISLQDVKDNWLTFLLVRQFTCSCGYSSHPENGNYVKIHHAPATEERTRMASYLQVTTIASSNASSEANRSPR